MRRSISERFMWCLHYATKAAGACESWGVVVHPAFDFPIATIRQTSV
jgi:hypothetical protein